MIRKYQLLAGLLLFTLVLFISIQIVMAEEEDGSKDKEDDDGVEDEQEGEHEGENEGYVQSAGIGLLFIIPTVGLFIVLYVRKRRAENRIVPEKIAVKL